MALHLSISLLLTGLTGVYSVTTVTRVSVKAGDSVSIPCLYHPKYTSHVKYLCQGYSFISCSCAVKTNQQSSGRFLISDDREKKVFTVTIKDVREGDTDFWCVVEINEGSDDGTYFQVSVTRGKKRTLRSTTQTTGVPCKGESSSSSSFLCQLRSSAARSPLLLVQTEWVSKQDLVTHCLLTSSQTSLILTNRIHVGAGLGCQQLQHLYETPSCSSFLINIPQTIKIYIQ
uniref:Immunoglobulin domain-containing protein n=1 Tax=Takifugu rubripes TaxID=31033 RepID=A0A674NXA8_TAKRU